jgi:hypothetical protein
MNARLFAFAKTVLLSLAASMTTALLLSSFASAKQAQDDYVSQASRTVGTYEPANRNHSPAAIVKAAKAFRTSLSDAQRKKLQFDLKSQERREWTNLPARPDAGGIRLGDLDQSQVEKACDLMACLFSRQGYNKIRDIMLADDQLLRNGQPRPGFGTENFSIVLFGEPEEDGSWAFQIDGHHVGVNVSINGSELTISPSFIGTQPEKFEIAGKSFEPFAGETGDAYELVNSLSDDQIRQAVLGPQRARILTGPGNDGRIPAAKGVSCVTFTKEQKDLVLRLIGNWVNDLPEDHAQKENAAN